ncbi:hypothetical protein SLEP1_g17165 [Rubroshorea leprosula]|uniref:Disease resistance RPP13-like protein 1 n=1 Tax=Rubroshorea leprosula TaxID=152421 RepID=A0AAV5J3U6_9ROSI|nr:hypothetical protein SLEP1_g17165 [Rubroshorea leprosula]
MHQMEVVSFVGCSLLSATLDLLFEKLNGYLSAQLWDSTEEIRAQMESWKTLLSKITAVLQHAEENQVANQFVKSCLDDLKDLAYDMEYILEEFVIDAKRSELIAESDARANKRQKIASIVMNFFRSKAKLNPKINSMVKDLSGRLQKIDNGMRSLDLANWALKLEDKSHKVAAKRLPESSLLEDMVLGRDSDKQAILQRLLEDGGSLEQDFVIPIVGMGGIGKTTLARLIYNDEKLEGKFDLKAWVCVADVFDVPKITRTILEQVTGRNCDIDDFDSLQKQLKGKLSGRKFFLILDDVWNKEYGNWDKLKRPFKSGALGSKIIVTTRNKDVGMMMRGDDRVYNLELLQDDACLPLFTRHALGKENFDAHPDLQDVGEKLVERCKRLPLALKTLGGVLRGKLCRDEWENILNSDIWSLSEDRSGILPALRLSYNDLPCHLKRCFVYCALFPKDYEFDKKELVLSWLKPHSNLKSLEISCYGGKCFPNWVCDPLLFLNLSSMKLSNCKRCTLLPSLGLLPVLKRLIIEGMDVIEAVGYEFYGGQDCFPLLEELVFRNMLNWKKWTSPTRSEGEFPCLYKLVIQNCPKLLGQLPSNLSSLKELDVRSCNAMLLKSMDDRASLAHLRIKRIAELTCLPMSMSLPSLKELYMENCNGVLLNCIVNLTSLTKLRIRAIAELTCLPKSFAQSLIALETLDIGYCNDLTCLWEEGAEIEQSLLPFNLKHLSLKQCRALESLPNAMMVQMDGSSSRNTGMLMLRLEKLEISGCDSVKSFPRGKLPITLKYLRIADCKGLGSLPDADSDTNSNLHLEISNLPCLYSSECCHQLPAFLKRFAVSGCKWVESFPERMLQHCMGLQSISICECTILKSLPTLDWVSNLVELSIESCGLLKSFPNTICQLKSLRSLSMEDCPGIKFIPDGGLPPSLTDLAFLDCKNLNSLPNTMYQLKSLQRLWLEDCLSIEFILDGGLPPNLTDLRLDCMNLKYIPNTMYQLTSLQRLTIPGGALTMGLQNLTSLQELTIEQEFPLDIVLPSSLTSLEIKNEENLKSIPGGLLQNLNSLQKLWIIDCWKLQSLPEEAFPPSLGELYISNCPFLKRQRFEAKGDYWTLTCAIPNVEIDDDEDLMFEELGAC